MTLRNSLLSACCALVASALAAQTLVPGPIPNPQRTSPARFSLSPAGARALGLGGAFVAVADDATAADSNPAGLTQLEERQVIVSGRTASLDTEFAGGLARGRVTNEQSISGPAFVGYVHPLGKVTLAGYFQRDAEFESGVRFEEEVLFLHPDLFTGYPYTVFDVRRYEQRLQTLGVAAAGRIGPSVSVGGSLRYQRLAAEWEDERGVDLIFILPDPLIYPTFIGTRTVVDDDDTDVTAVVGLLFHPEGRWRAGLSYQQGGDFSQTARSHFTGFVFPLPLFFHEIEMNLPDVASAGASFAASERWLLSAQVSHLTWSDLGKAPQFPLADFGSFIPGSPYFGDDPSGDETQLHLGTEVRLGASERPFSLRAGLWTDPDHDTARAIDTDQTHLALGAGKVLAGGWSLDGAVRFGDTVTEGLVGLSFGF